MTGTQLYLAIGVPIIAILVSMTLSLIQISGIRADMRVMRAEFREDQGSMRTEFREGLRSLREEVREDFRILTGKVVDIDNRLTRIEERMEHRP